MYLNIIFFLQRVLYEFLSILVVFLSILHSSSYFEFVSNIVSVLIDTRKNTIVECDILRIKKI